MNDYAPILKAAEQVILQVMKAGAHQRIKNGKDEHAWKTCNPTERLHHAFMHLVACKTHESNNGHPYSLTSDTALEDWKHALCGLAIVAAHELGYMSDASQTIDTTEDELKGE